MKKWLFPLLVLLAIGGAAGYYFYQRAHRPPEVLYKTAPVERRSISSRVTASGTLQARVTVQVGSQVSGRVLALYADFNSKVKKGDIVAKLDPQLFQAALEQARANFASAQANAAKADATLIDAERQYERSKTQKAEGLASQQDVDTAQTAAAVARAGVDAAKANVEQARAALNQDQVNVSLTVIKSPIDGIVISRSVDVGQTVAASLQAPVLFTIAEDLTKMHIEASVPESDVGKLAVDMPVAFTVDAFPGQRFRGTIEQVRNAAVTVQNVVTYTAIVAVDNPELKLRPGMTATVTIVTARRNDTLAVPNAALRFKPPGAPAASAGRGAGRPNGGAATGGSAWPSGSGHGRHAPGAASSGAPSASPPGSSAPVASASGAPKASGAPASSADALFGGGSDDTSQKTAYLLKNNAPLPVKLTVGITDGSFTELIDGPLKEGDGVIVEGPPSDSSGSSPPAAQGQGQGQRGASGGAPRMRGVF